MLLKVPDDSGHRVSRACSPKELKGISARELLALDIPEQAFIVDRLIPPGLTLLVGKPKAGKSLFCLNLAIDVAEGAKVLDKYDSTPGTVLYLALEDSPKRLQNRIAKMLSRRRAPDNLLLYTTWSKLGDGAEEALLEICHSQPNIRLVIIDTFAMIRPLKPTSRQNLYLEDYATVVKLKEIADELGIALVLVHHTRKQEASDDIDTISGTTGLTGAADTILIFKRDRHKTTATLAATGRDIDEDEILVEIDKDRLYWKCIGDSLLSTLSPERREIVRIIQGSTSPISSKEIADKLAKKEDAVRQLVRKLNNDGVILKVKYGKYTMPNDDHIDHNDHNTHN